MKEEEGHSEMKSDKPAKFRKKAVVIEAVRVPTVGDDQPWNTLKKFMAPAESWVTSYGTVKIKTLEGVMEANAGDWIIKGVAGEFYPCKPDIFEKTYDAVGDES